jgi:RNA-directed DNA polymerase
MKFTFTSRSYLQFDYPVAAAYAEQLATDAKAVAEHAFLPFIRYTIVSQKLRKKPDGGVEVRPPKKRPIAYAAHKDAHIFSHYSSLLVDAYERELQARELHQVVTAFRSLDKKRNIHFANEAFEFIRASGECYVLATDISDYFGQIIHRLLKLAWSQLLGGERLPADHYKVFRAITKYALVDRERLSQVLNLDPDSPRADGRRRYCSPDEFRVVVRGNGLISVNRSGRGIPQGSPISALLSNLYLLEFDTTMNAAVIEHGGLYRRYCDDILFVMPTAELRQQVRTLMVDLLTKLGLVAHPDKTEPVDFKKVEDRLTTANPLNYLGFTFDGENKRIRPASIARYYRKMKRGVSRAKAIRYRICQKEGAWTPLRRRKLHLLYSYLGRHNFLSYAFTAAKIMNDPGIKKQVKAHWKRLQQLIKPPENA